MVCKSTSDEVSKIKDLRYLIEDLFEPDPKIFWVDLWMSSALGWLAFGIACYFVDDWPIVLTCLTIAIFSLYRALTFIHELAHLRKGVLPGFAFIWNLIVGIPLLFPSFIYISVHSDHHRPLTYGTEADPEYLPFSGNRVMIIVFLMQTLLIPALILVRFIVLAPIGLILPNFHDILERKASSLTMNLAYVRTVNTSESIEMKKVEIFILAVWLIPIILIGLGMLSVKYMVLWYIVTAAISFVNAIRTLGAHRYHENNQASRSRQAQIEDSVDTPNGLFTVFLAPTGLRYHALHHYYPSLPYHNLQEAYRRITQQIDNHDPYWNCKSPSLFDSLKRLWIKPTPF